MISVLHLGTVDYATALQLQQRLVALRKEGAIGDVLLLLEHTPVITLGRNAKASNVLVAPDRLASHGVQLFECDRGGDVTFHGPGQLVAYPIFDLHGFASTDSARKNMGAVEFVRRLEEVLIHVCGNFGIRTQRIPGLTGVWTAPAAEGEQAKIAAIGVHISRAVTSHGFALNVSTNLDYFSLIVPCGIASRPVTSMQKELGRTLSIEDVEKIVARAFGNCFQSEVVPSATLDDLLTPNLDIPVKAPRQFRELHHEDETSWA
jgi:lipoyl(octanoyl) transferase